MSGREFFPRMGCKYTIAPDADLSSLMADLTSILGSGASLFEVLADAVADNSSPESEAYWGGLYLLRQSHAIAQEVWARLPRETANDAPAPAGQQGGAA